MRLFRSELLKIRSTRLWIGLLLGAAALTLLGALATLSVAGTEQGAQAGVTPLRTVSDVRDFVYVANATGLFTVILGAIAVTGEYRSGTMAGTFLASPTRSPVVIAKAVACSVIGIGFGVACALIAVICAEGYFLTKGLPLQFGSSVGVAILVVAATSATSAAIGVGVGAVLRSQLVTVLALLGWGLVVEQVVGGLLHSWQKWLPFAEAQASLAQQEPDLLAPLPGGLLLIGYVALAVVVGIWFTRRRDIT